MNVTVENLGPCKKLVRVEVEAQAVEAVFEKTTNDVLREARLPGFRPGKAPRDMVAKSYAKEIQQETRRKLLSENYRKAITEHKLRVIGTPEIEEILFDRGQPFQFAITMETAPEFELPEYKGLVVRVENRVVAEEDVDRALNTLRLQRAAYKDVARPVQTGDFVVVNYAGTCEGKPLTEFAPTAAGLTEKKKSWLHVEPGQFIPGFTEQLVGAQAGEKRTVNVNFPAEFVVPQLSGKNGVYEVEVLQVKERVLPELNDAFANEYGAETLFRLREGIRNDLQNELKFKHSNSIKNQLIGQLLQRVAFELPESLVANATRGVITDIVKENTQRGLSKAAIEAQKEEIYSYATANAKDRIKVAFLLGRIAEKENITATQQEVTNRVYYLAQQYQVKPEKFIKQLEEKDGIAEIQEQIITAKVLDFLQLHAKIEEVPAGAATA